MQDTIIIGAGITGLTAAYLLKKKGEEITLLERSKTAGGPISTVKKDGYLAETGPNSLLLPNTWCEEFLEELGLNDKILEASPAAHKRYIARDGKPVAVPMSPAQAVTTRLFSLKAKIGFLAEPFRKAISHEDAETETVASFVSRRMGPEFLHYAIDPFVSGIYAGNPHELILKHAFPLMRSFEENGGSIIRGALKRKKQQKKDGTAYKKRSITFKEGLETLPFTLAAKIGDALELNSCIQKIEKLENGWHVSYEQNGNQLSKQARRLMICIPSHAIKSLPWEAKIQAKLNASPDLPFPAVHSLSLGFSNEQITHPLDGFGMLIPGLEKSDILGALFCSSVYSDRAPEGHCLLTVMLGGQRRPDLAERSIDELQKIAMNALGPLIGAQGKPTFRSLSTWPRAIPQYNESFAPWKATIAQIESESANLYFGGNCIDGIAMGACIVSGKRLSEIADD